MSEGLNGSKKFVSIIINIFEIAIAYEKNTAC